MVLDEEEMFKVYRREVTDRPNGKSISGCSSARMVCGNSKWPSVPYLAAGFARSRGRRELPVKEPAHDMEKFLV
jgi:hypothetical protein